jgi:cell division septation protein DedD
LVVEFGSGRSGAWFAHPAKVHTHRAQDLSEFSKPLSASPSQSHEEPQSEAQIAAPLWSSQSANHDGVPPRRAPVADAPHPVAAKARAENTGATLIDPPSGFLPEMQKTLTSTNSVSPEPAVTPPTSYDSLTYEQERKLRYEIRRAQSSFGVGQYTNAVYHLKRALLLDPGSSEIRDLLQRAQAAQLKPEKSAGSTAPSPAPPAAVAWPDYRPEMPLGEPSGSASGEISAPPVSAAEDLPPVNSGGPSARASEEVAVPPVPAAEHLPPLNGGGSLARASGKGAPTPDSPTALHTASAEQVPAARRTLFNIQIQAAMDQKNAERMVDRLRQLGYQPHLVTNGIGGQTWYQVEIGPYPSHDEAAAAKATLRLKYDSTFDPPAPNPGDDSPDLLNPFSPTPLPIGLSAER